LRVPELVGVPAVALSPPLYLGPSLLPDPGEPLLVRLALAPGQRRRRREGGVAGVHDGVIVGGDPVALAGCTSRVLLRSPLGLTRRHGRLAVPPQLRPVLLHHLTRLEQVLLEVEAQPGAQHLLSPRPDEDDAGLPAVGGLVLAVRPGVAARPVAPHPPRHL